MAKRMRNKRIAGCYLLGLVTIVSGLLGTSYAYWTDELKLETHISIEKLEPEIVWPNSNKPYFEVGNAGKGQFLEVSIIVEGNMDIKYIGYGQYASITEYTGQTAGVQPVNLGALKPPLNISHTASNGTVKVEINEKESGSKALNMAVYNQIKDYTSGDKLYLDIPIYIGGRNTVVSSGNSIISNEKDIDGWYYKAIARIPIKHGSVLSEMDIMILPELPGAEDIPTILPELPEVDIPAILPELPGVEDIPMILPELPGVEDTPTILPELSGGDMPVALPELPGGDTPVALPELPWEDTPTTLPGESGENLGEEQMTQERSVEGGVGHEEN